MGTETQHEDGDEDQPRADHLSDVDDGCGCAEIWERLADIRASE